MEATQVADEMPLPALEDGPCRAVEAKAEAEARGEWTPLRSAFEVLSAAHYAMAGKAEELLHWKKHNNYCGQCGAPMRPASDISLRCTGCGREIWPSPAVAVMVAITRDRQGAGAAAAGVGVASAGQELLLVQSRQFKGNFMGLVAGFVETGETLEEAVRREVKEETGLEIKDLQYFQSQPWPYPFQLMVGFTARWAAGELRLQESELRQGGWYPVADLPEIPGRVSLARRLIDHVVGASCIIDASK